MNHGRVTYTRHTSYISFYKAIKDCGRADDVRPLSDSRNALGNYEKRMIPGDMTGYAMFYSITEQPFCGYCEPVMKKTKIGKAVGLPPVHVRFHFVDCVPTRRHPQPTNSFPASLTVDLGCSPHVKAWIRL